jgi:hypothetical protein
MTRMRVLLIAAIVVCLAPASASATNLGTTGGFTYVKESAKMKNGFVADDVTAKCPGDTVSVGGGSTIDAHGSEHRAWIAESSGAKPSGWFTSGAHFELIGGKAKLTSWAVCSKEKSHVHRNHRRSGADDESIYISTTSCNRGNVTSGGFQTTGTPKDWMLLSSAPFSLIRFAQGDPFTGWSAEARHTNAVNSSFTADTICMTGGEPEYPTFGFTSDAEVARRVLECPRGLSISGGGFFTEDPSETHIIESRPADLPADKDKIPDDAWDISYHNDEGGSHDYAIAATCR